MKLTPEQVEWMRVQFGLLATAVGSGDIRATHAYPPPSESGEG